MNRGSELEFGAGSARAGAYGTARPSSGGTPWAASRTAAASREAELADRLSDARAEAEAARLDFLAAQGDALGDTAVRSARQRWDNARQHERRLEQLLLTIPARHAPGAGAGQ